jgi:hypothetical protein
VVPLLLGVAFRANFSDSEFAMIAMYDVGTVIHGEYSVNRIDSVPRNTYSLGKILVYPVAVCWRAF